MKVKKHSVEAPRSILFESGVFVGCVMVGLSLLSLI